MPAFPSTPTHQYYKHPPLQDSPSLSPKKPHRAMAYRDSTSSNRSPSSSPRLPSSPFLGSTSRLPLPLWRQGPMSMSSPLAPEAAIPSTLRITPLKLLLVILASALVSQLLPSVPAWASDHLSAAPHTASTSTSLSSGPSSDLPFLVDMTNYRPMVPPPPKGIPNLVHFVFGYKGTSGELFPYYAYLAVRSALVNLQPDEILFHHLHEPYGPFWDLLKPHLTLVKTPAPTEIYGKPLRHFAYQADVIRLEALIARGGIYLDIDTYVIRPFTPLLGSEMVMGMEALHDNPSEEPQGLCNAVILSAPNNTFVERWLRSYDTFVEGQWSGHSVRKPWELAQQHPAEITVLNTRAFFWPLWDGRNIPLVHEEATYDFHASGQFAYHAWESKAHDYLDVLTPQHVHTAETSFTKMVRPYTTPQDEDTYRAWAELATDN